MTAPVSLLGQWPAYPTASVPRTADGKPTSRRLPLARPTAEIDLTGVWNYAGRPRIPRWTTAFTSRHSTRGDVLEHRGRNQGRPAVPPVGRRVAEAAHGGREQGQPGCSLPSARTHAAAHTLTAAEDDSDARISSSSSTRPTPVCARSSWMAGLLPTTTRNHGGSDTHAAGGKTTRWSSKRLTSAISAGST